MVEQDHRLLFFYMAVHIAVMTILAEVLQEKQNVLLGFEIAFGIYGMLVFVHWRMTKVLHQSMFQTTAIYKIAEASYDTVMQHVFWVGFFNTLWLGVWMTAWWTQHWSIWDMLLTAYFAGCAAMFLYLDSYTFTKKKKQRRRRAPFEEEDRPVRMSLSPSSVPFSVTTRSRTYTS